MSYNVTFGEYIGFSLENIINFLRFRGHFPQKNILRNFRKTLEINQTHPINDR